jgi:hypothetical protein
LQLLVALPTLLVAVGQVTFRVVGVFVHEDTHVVVAGVGVRAPAVGVEGRDGVIAPSVFINSSKTLFAA